MPLYTIYHLSWLCRSLCAFHTPIARGTLVVPITAPATEVADSGCVSDMLEKSSSNLAFHWHIGSELHSCSIRCSDRCWPTTTIETPVRKVCSGRVVTLPRLVGVPESVSSRYIPQCPQHRSAPRTTSWAWIQRQFSVFSPVQPRFQNMTCNCCFEHVWRCTYHFLTLHCPRLAFTESASDCIRRHTPG